MYYEALEKEVNSLPPLPQIPFSMLKYMGSGDHCLGSHNSVSGDNHSFYSVLILGGVGDKTKQLSVGV